MVSRSATLEGQSEADGVLARRLVDARLDARVLQEYPGDLPKTLEQAYGVQMASIALWPDEVVGWKVARLPVDDRARFAQERLVGPVFRSTAQAVDSGGTVKAKIFDGGFAAIEAEVVLELGADVQADFDPGNPDELVGLVAKAFCGAEIASSPMPLVIERGATSIISDMGINVGVIAGPEIVDYLDLGADSLEVCVSVDGDLVGKASPGAITGSPFTALKFLIEHCIANSVELPKGTLISTGLITGVHEVSVGSKARVDFGGQYWFDVDFEPLLSQRSNGT